MRTRPRIERVLPAKAPRPASNGALNLADLDPPVWHVMSHNTAHGPFTLGQLQAFADSGKIGPLTRISSGNGEPFTKGSRQRSISSKSVTPSPSVSTFLSRCLRSR